MLTHRVSKARVQTQVNSIQSNSTCYQKLDNTYGNRYSSDRLGEFKIVRSMSPSLLRNEEKNNIITSSSTAILNITAVDGNTLTLNSLPQNLICSTSIDWFIQNLDPSNFNYSEPSYSGDYTIQDKVASFDFDNNKVTLVDAAGFDVGDDVCLYSPWANYEFMPGQESAGIISAGGTGWRGDYVGSGPAWYNSDDENYYIAFYGKSTDGHVQIGIAYSSDLKNWTIGNGDAPIITNADHANFTTHVIPGGSAIDDGSGRIAFTVSGYNGTDRYCHIIQMDKDGTNIAISDSLLTGATWYSCGLGYFNSKYVIIALKSNAGALETWTVEMWDSDNLTSGWAKKCDVLTTEYDGNDSVWLEGHSDAMLLFVEDGKLYSIIAGTQRYTISGIQGNRQYGLMEYDADTETWSIVNDYAPEIIHPMYFYNIASEDYGWAGGHTGGYGSIIKKDGHCYFFCSFLYTAGTYQVAALELKNNT